MVTPVSDAGSTIYAQELAGLSGDTKPTDDIPNGSTYLEMDTGNVYVFDKENERWRQL